MDKIIRRKGAISKMLRKYYSTLLITVGVILYLISTKSLYLELDEWFVIVLITLLLSRFFKYKILTSYVFYFTLFLFDIMSDFLFIHLSNPIRDGRIPPLWREVIPESFDDYSLLNFTIPLAVGLISMFISKKRGDDIS